MKLPYFLEENQASGETDRALGTKFKEALTVRLARPGALVPERRGLLKFCACLALEFKTHSNHWAVGRETEGGMVDKMKALLLK